MRFVKCDTSLCCWRGFSAAHLHPLLNILTQASFSDPPPPGSRYVVALPGLVCSPLPAGVSLGPGRLWSVSVLPGTRTARFPQVEQQNSPSSAAGGQRELQRRWQKCPDLTRKEGRRKEGRSRAGPAAPSWDRSQPLTAGGGWGRNMGDGAERRPRPSFQPFPDLCSFPSRLVKCWNEVGLFWVFFFGFH